MKKHRIIVIICVVLFAVLSGVAATAWHNQSVVQQQAVEAKAHAQQEANKQLQKAAVELERQRISDECHDKQKAFDAQPAAAQKTSTRPACDLPELE